MANICFQRAGVIKTILVLEKGVIPPIAELDELNPEIDAQFLKLKVLCPFASEIVCTILTVVPSWQFPTTTIPWPSTGLRRASVSSFGFGGTNAHVVLDDAFHYLHSRGIVANHSTNVPQFLQGLDSGTDLLSRLGSVPRLFTWSASDSKTAARMGEAYQQYLEGMYKSGEMTDCSLDQLAHALATKRTLLPCHA